MKLLLISIAVLMLAIAPLSAGSSMAETEPLDECPGSGTYCRTKDGRALYIGPRGGCFYCNKNGNKTYVDRSLCEGC
jgi:hypothetical protein